MRAAAYLLIYNMVEASARSFTESILDAIAPAGIALSDLSPALRREILRQAYRKGKHLELVELLDDTSLDLTVNYDPKEIFSGNVDARAIRERLVELGCPEIDFKNQHNVETTLLRTLKNTRNDLAHGTKSFATVGRTSTQSMIERTFSAALRTLRASYNEVDLLLSNRKHLK